MVMDFVNETGFDPVDSGSLAGSWRQQPSTPAYCCDYGAEKTREGLASAVRGKAEKIRDTYWLQNHLRLYADNPSYAEVHDDEIASNRASNAL